MSIKVSEMTDVDLRKMIGEIVEEKLKSLFVNEDSLELKSEIESLLNQQIKQVKDGERGESMESVISKLGLN